MRSLGVLAALAALVLPATASAKSWITLSGAGGGVAVGERWDATLRFPVHPHGLPLPRRPELVFTHLDTYEQRRFVARPTQPPGVYRARVALDLAGRWTVYVYAREVGAVTPGARGREVVVRAAESGSGWGGRLWIGALAACVLALAVATRLRRRARPAPFRASPAARA